MLAKFDKKYLANAAFKVTAVLLCVLTAFYLGYHIWRKVTTTVEFTLTTPFSVSEKSTGSGYVIRSETVISSSGGGSLVATVEEGERVGYLNEVARIYSSSSPDIEARLSEIDRQIALFSASLSDGELTSRDVSKIDDEIYSTLTEIKKSVAMGEYSEALSQKSSLISGLNKRDIASGKTDGIASGIALLQAEKQNLTSRLGSLVSIVSAPSSGWYYSGVDGYEGIFDASSISSLTYEKFEAAVAASPADTSFACGKIVTDFRWYFVCDADVGDFEDRKEGDVCTVCFPYNRGIALDMTLEKISKSEDGLRAIGVFSSDRIPAGFDFTRMQSYEIIEKEYTGFRIPKSAVRVENGHRGVYVLSGEIIHFKWIDILTEYEGSYIVSMDGASTAATPVTSKNVTESDNTETGNADAEDTGELLGSDWITKSENRVTKVPKSTAAGIWIDINENVIIKGKGLKEGRIITNVR